MSPVESAGVHPSAVISESAQLAEGVSVGPFCVIGEDVSIGQGTVVGPHTVIEGPSLIGRMNRFYGQASIGTDPQDLKYRGEKSALHIGDGNRIREFVTIHRGTELADNKTVVGNGNLIMTGVHIAHDCRLGDGIILGNSATLGGHVMVEDHARVGAFSGVHQFCRVGTRAFIGPYSVITRDTLPFIQTVGKRGENRIFGINATGLERDGFSAQRIDALKKAYRILFQKKLTIRQAVETIRQEGLETEDVAVLIRFIESSERGFVR